VADFDTETVLDKCGGSHGRPAALFYAKLSGMLFNCRPEDIKLFIIEQLAGIAFPVGHDASNIFGIEIKYHAFFRILKEPIPLVDY